MKKDTPMVKHQIEILETLRIVVEVELPANSTIDARAIVMDKYYNEEIVLSADNYDSTEFHHLGVKNK